MPASTPPMSMNKVIHGAVRRDLDRFRRALDAFTDGDRDRAEALHRAWANFDAQLTEHHEGEHEIAWPAMKALQTTTVTHLDHEEQETEAVLAQHEGDPAVKEMGRKFSRRVGPAKAGIFFAWVQDGATPEEQAALTASVPRPVLAVLGGLLGRRYRKEVAPVWST